MSLDVFMANLDEVRFQKGVWQSDDRCTATKLCKIELCIAENSLDSIIIIIICLFVKLPNRYIVVRLLCCYAVIVLMAFSLINFFVSTVSR